MSTVPPREGSISSYVSKLHWLCTAKGSNLALRNSNQKSPIGNCCRLGKRAWPMCSISYQLSIGINGVVVTWVIFMRKAVLDPPVPANAYITYPDCQGHIFSFFFLSICGARVFVSSHRSGFYLILSWYPMCDSEGYAIARKRGCSRSLFGPGIVFFKQIIALMGLGYQPPANRWKETRRRCSKTSKIRVWLKRDTPRTGRY